MILLFKISIISNKEIFKTDCKNVLRLYNKH